jgi:hypothetical protein
MPVTISLFVNPGNRGADSRAAGSAANLSNRSFEYGEALSKVLADGGKPGDLERAQFCYGPTTR